MLKLNLKADRTRLTDLVDLPETWRGTVPDSDMLAVGVSIALGLDTLNLMLYCIWRREWWSRNNTPNVVIVFKTPFV